MSSSSTPTPTFRILAMVMVAGLLLLAVPDARADYLYSFNYQATSGAIQTFSFSFTTPALITVPPDYSPAFTPFTFTDGTTTWTMDQAVAGFDTVYNRGCFDFGSPDAAVFGDCYWGFGTLPTSGAIYIAFTGGLPNSVGTFTSDQFEGASWSTILNNDRFFSHNAGALPDTGTFTLTISQAQTPVPEPSSLLLLASGAVALIGRFRKPVRG